MKGASLALEARLELEGHPNFFPSTPQPNTKEWDLLQSYDHRTLICTTAIQGTGGVWRSAVADLTADVEDTQQLLHNLAVVRRNVSPTTHGTVLLMPRQQFLKRLLSANPHYTNEELIDIVEQAADVYAQNYVDGPLPDPAPDGSPWTLKAALGCMESFYLLQALPQKWSPYHYYKCNCPECFKTGSCTHSLLAGMVCHSEIRVPSHCLGATIQGRRKRGRPSGRGSDIGDVGEMRARVRSELERAYKLPKVRACMFNLFDSL
jgi:hypothetical protein